MQFLDIKKEWGNIGTGEYPPGWVPEFDDDDGNVIGGDWQSTFLTGR